MVDELQRLLEIQAETITDHPHRIPFVINDSSMLPEDFPVTKKDDQTFTELVIIPAKVGTFLRIYPLIAKIEKEDLEKITVSPERAFDVNAPEIMLKYTEVIIEIICIGLHNRRGEYPEYMPEFIKENCAFRDLHVILNAILFRLGTMAFTDSTTMLMKVGPGAEGMIALQENLTSWKEEKRN